MDEMEAPDIYRAVFAAYKAGEFKYLDAEVVHDWIGVSREEPGLFYGYATEGFLAIHRGHCLEVHFVDADDEDVFSELSPIDGDQLVDKRASRLYIVPK